MQIVKTKKTSLLSPLNANDTSFTLKEFTDHKGNPVVLADFEGLFVVTIRQGSSIEMILCDGLTQNADGSATCDIATNGRDLSAKYPYTGSAVGEDFSSGAEAVNGDDPYTVYQITIAYTNSLVISGAPNASLTIKGISEIADTTDLDNDAADGSGDTDAPLVATPSKLAASKYGTRLPSAEQKVYLNAVTGMIIPYAGDTAPTGFLNCDGASYSASLNSALALVLKGKFGYNTGVVMTAAVTDIITSTSHGLVTGDIVFFSTTTTLPAGLSVHTPYYVRDETGNTFKVSATVGGAAIDITSTGTGTHYFHTQVKVPDLRSSVPVGQGLKTVPISFLFSDVNTGTDIITLPPNESVQTGMALVLTTTGGVPTPQGNAGTGFSVDSAGLITGAIISEISGNGQTINLTFQNSTAFGLGTYYVINFSPGVSCNFSGTPGGSIAGSGNSGSGQCQALGLVAGATYYAIRLSSTTIKLATSYANAVTGTALNLLTQGTGTHTLTLTLTNRTIGSIGGEENHSLTIEELPDGVPSTFTTVVGEDGSGSQLLSTVTVDGNNQAHNTMPPFLVVNFIIKT